MDKYTARRAAAHLANMAAESEKAIEAHLVEGCRRLGLLCLKYSNPNEAGYPDRLVLLPAGQVIWVEIKSRNRKTRLLQNFRIDELRKCGHIVYVADSTDFIDFLLEGFSDIIAKAAEQ